MKAKKLIAGVAAVAVAGACGVALTACSKSSSNTSKSYSMTINSWSDYTDEHDVPFLTGMEGAIFGFDSWIVSGTKVNFDDDGNPVDCYWTFNLEVEDSIVANHVDYVMTFYFHGGATELYSNPIDAVYKFYGLGYEIDGGYHLYVANFAEATITLNCAVETPGWPENGDTGEGEGTFVRLDGPNGLIYYHYCNSDIQAAGGTYGFPFNNNLTQGFSECDVLISGSAISGFDNITKTTSVVVEAGSGSSGGGDIGGFPGPGPSEGEGEGNEGGSTSSNVYTDPEMEAAATEGGLTGDYTYEYEKEGMGGSKEACTATITFQNDGNLEVSVDAGEFAGTTVCTATYKVYEDNGTKYVIIKGIGLKEADDRGNEVGSVPSSIGGYTWNDADGNTIIVLGAGNTFAPYVK